jgi:NAD(P)-dependent dehydrogenase (short-subunit alcohol dehydrogenase family)
MGKLSGKVVVITGASSGSARATAHEFARAEANIALAARRETVLEEVAAECRALGGAAPAVPTDVSNPAAVAALPNRAIETFGSIDIWINCAAVVHFGRLEETPPDIIEPVLTTNIIGYFHGAQVAVGHFSHQRRGTLINVSSVLGITAQPFASAYVASKFAIMGWARASIRN